MRHCWISGLNMGSTISLLTKVVGVSRRMTIKHGPSYDEKTCHGLMVKICGDHVRNQKNKAKEKERRDKLLA